MSVKLLVVPIMAASAAVGLTLATAEPSVAQAKFKTTVTIKADNTDLSGTISSSNNKTCSKGRTVLLIKQVGSRGGSNDQKIASDTAQKQGSKYVWSTGNTGISGKFYAKVKPTAACAGATSKTVRATR